MCTTRRSTPCSSRSAVAAAAARLARSRGESRSSAPTSRARSSASATRAAAAGFVAASAAAAAATDSTCGPCSTTHPPGARAASSRLGWGRVRFRARARVRDGVRVRCAPRAGYGHRSLPSASRPRAPAHTRRTVQVALPAYRAPAPGWLIIPCCKYAPSVEQMAQAYRCYKGPARTCTDVEGRSGSPRERSAVSRPRRAALAATWSGIGLGLGLGSGLRLELGLGLGLGLGLALGLGRHLCAALRVSRRKH